MGSRILNYSTLTFPDVGQVDLEGAVASATLDHTPGNVSVAWTYLNIAGTYVHYTPGERAKLAGGQEDDLVATWAYRLF